MVSGISQRATSRVSSYYPEFGEKTAPRMNSSWGSAARVIATIGSAALFGGVLGSTLSLTAIGLASGVALGSGASLIALTTAYLFDSLFPHHLLSELPVDGQHPVYQSNRAKVGRYYQTDLRLTKTTLEAFEWKKTLIASAKRSIELSPNFAGGPYFQEVLGLIEERMEVNSELKTHIILSDDLFETGDLEALQRLAQKFPERFAYLVSGRHYSLELDAHSQENHVKMLIVDGKYFVAGGTGIHHNLSSETQEEGVEGIMASGQLAAKGMRDTDVVGESSYLAQTMRKQFYNLYRIHEIRIQNAIVSNRYFALTGRPGHCKEFDQKKGLVTKSRVKLIVGGPEHSGDNPIETMYAKRCEKAKNEIRIAHPLFVPQERFKAALQRVKELGVKILGYFNSNHGVSISKHSLYTFPSRGYYHFMDTVHEYKVKDQLLHKKMATFDETHTMIGSFNFDRKSTDFDHEIALVIKDKRITKQAREVLNEDATLSERIEREEIEKNHFWNSFVTKIFEPLTQNFF